MFVVKYKFYDRFMYATDKYEFAKEKEEAAVFKSKKDAICFLKTIVYCSEESNGATMMIIEKI